MKYINKEKIESISLTKLNFYVAIDFDKTITAIESHDSWMASGQSLGEEFNKKSNMLSKKYEPIELNYNISLEEKTKAMEEWYYKSVDLYYKYNLTTKLLEESVDNSNMIFRDGAKEFLYEMYKNDIPVIILSAGIGNVIEYFLYKNSCLYNNIYIISNFLKFDHLGNIKKYDEKLIHTLNKTMQGHVNDEICSKIINKKYRLLIGDFVEDKNMVPFNEWDKTISVRIFTKKC